MKSKIVKGIINGGVLAAVAALGITVYQLGTKPIVDNQQEESTVQTEETGLEEDLSGEEDLRDAAVYGNGTEEEDADSDEQTENGAAQSDSAENHAAGNGEKLSAGQDSGNAAKTEENTGNTSTVKDTENTAGTENSGDTAETSAAGIAAQTLNFTEDSIMEWPVRGTVLVDYNMNETVYYPTLDQYRVSPAVSLQAVEDAPVYAAADGQVLVISQDACTGTTVTMELGNGYQAVYGQLKDLTVKEGDTVKEGTVIGNISAPTKYYSVEGPNLYFAVKKDGEPVDPFEYLE